MARDNDREQRLPSRQYGSSGTQRSPYYGRGYELSYPRSGESDWWSGSPFQMMRRMHDEMDRLFSSLFGPSAVTREAPGGGQPMQTWSPSVDIYETEKEYVIKADVPGVEPEDLEVYCTEDALILRGEMRREEERQEPSGGHRSERRYGRFERQFPLPPGTRTEEIQANCRQGVLEIRIPKPQEAQQRARRVPIGSQTSARAGQGGTLSGVKGGETASTTGGAAGSQTGAQKSGTAPGAKGSQATGSASQKTSKAGG